MMRDISASVACCSLLLTGASGQVGGELAKILAARREPTRALVRDRAKATPLDRLGIEILEGDLNKPETLTPAFQGVDKAFLLPAPGSNQVVQSSNVMTAAGDAGVRHLVKISSFLPDAEGPNPVARWHAESNRQLERSGIPYTILRGNFFMQNLLMFRAAIRKHGAPHMPCGNAVVAMIGVRDRAAVAAAVLTSPATKGRPMPSPATGPSASTASRGRSPSHSTAASRTCPCHPTRIVVISWPRGSRKRLPRPSRSSMRASALAVRADDDGGARRD